MASPLTEVCISIILEYILPPSQITQGIPPHLLSEPLLQRHHFLDIHHADDPVSYISWPSSDQRRAFETLETYSLTTRDPSDFHIRYAADHESLYAHAELGSSGLRLVFHWDSRDEAWKYHNLALMPIPSPSYDSPSTAQKNLPLTNGSDSREDVDTEEDAYWDSYGQDDGGDKFDAGRRASKTDSQGEDAYWAQYANVQGTADSTIPSPVINSKRKALPADDHHGEQWDAHMSRHTSDDYANHWQSSAREHTEDVLEIPSSSLVIKPPNQYNPHSPPSPRELSDRLSALSPQEDREAVLEKHLNGTLNGTGKPPDFAVKESIRGVYRLWKLSSPSGFLNGDAEKERFLQLVREALE
ncbi:hypothetical protein D9758_000269 [Tetrapyrgos nigripes]|uniref:Uncharacterized protein n=1 Tax=Tetrapyrgos nigripes TaxID=182062 RepID=A0A8H5H1T6_9AGAR|nr:hypothetical protein D9758_000269 [Tetrapyrgos nigripes]